MPCRDHWPSPEQEDRLRYINDLKKRNDLLAAEACAARTVMLQVLEELKQAAGNQFPTAEDPLKDWLVSNPKLLVAIEKQKTAQIAHREADRDAYLSALREERRKLTQRIAEITKLGGLPSKATVRQLRVAKRTIKEVKASDPLRTELY